MYGISVVLHRGKVHDYLRMIIDYSHKGKVMVNMTEYIKNIISNFLEEIIGMKASPASVRLFEVQVLTLSKLLPKEQAQVFHHTVTQILFLSTRARKDIQPAMAFLTSRVKTPDEDDWGKEKRVLRFLKKIATHATSFVRKVTNSGTMVGGCSIYSPP
jgi:hypothetical protein